MIPNNRRVAAQMAVPVVAGALALVLAAPVAASHVMVSMNVPNEIELGRVVAIPVALSAADGAPLRGTTVRFYLDGSFAGVSGEVELGRAVTDEGGVATLAYQPRTAGRHEIRMEYLLPTETEPEISVMSIDVAGETQLYSSAPGVEIPGLGVGLLMVVLATVWTILFGIALLLLRIARAGATPRQMGSGRAA